MNLDLIVTLSRPFYEKSQDPSHDWAHIMRVARSCESIGKKEGAKLELLLPSAYMHDLINLPKNHPNRSEASTMTGVKAEEFLKQANYNDEQISLIKQIIKEHSYSKGLRPSSVEAAILQDADRLDAIGAIGILRCASVATQMGASFYHVEDLLGEQRELDDKKFMLDHYQTKLYKLPSLMNTETGKIEAQKRVQFMETFIQQLRHEISTL